MPNNPLEFKTVMGRRGEINGAPIMFCDDHSREVDNRLVEHGFDRNALIPSVLHIPGREKAIYPGIIAFQVLVQLALSSVGSKGTIEDGKGCPICAFKNFDWPTHIAKLIADQINGPKPPQ